jgi:hypothetical protein
MNYDQQILKINNEILEVKKKIKEVNGKTTNALYNKNNQLWREVIKDESSIIIAISNIKLTVDKLSIENPDTKSINNILGSYINLMKQSNMIRVGLSSLNWRINKIYDKETTILEIIILLKEIVFVLSQIIKPILIIGEENKIQSLMEQGKQIESTLSNINNDAYELVNIIETKNLNNINNITIEKLDIIEQLVKIKEDKNNYISLFLTILKKKLVLIINTKMLIGEIVLTTQKIVEDTKKQYIETAENFTNILPLCNNQENRNNIWKLNLEWVKKYINENKKRPTKKNKDEKKYGAWLTLQVQNYQKKKEIMSNETIRHLWKDFISEYKTYFK